MPSAVPYTPRQFVPDRYEPRGRLADYARQRGADQADSIRRSGDISAQMWGGIGQNIAGTLREIAAIPAQRQAAALMQQKAAREEQAYKAQQTAQQAEAQKAARLKELMQIHAGNPPPEVLLQEFGPQDAAEIVKAISTVRPQPKAPGTREVKTRNADGSESIQIVPDTAGQTFTSAAPVEKPKTYQVTVPGPNGPITKTFNEEQMQQGVPTYRAPVAPPTPKAKFWVIRDGKQLRISEDEYRPGDQNASTREQGRPVTSGDAGRIADLDTSLNDLDVLAATVTGSTGTSAKIGASLPNWVTELTGRGTSAKQKQASIDRVKQVIGKALEGGVLRKEDEVKYEKILPTIYDPPEVVASKLQGLQQALTLRRQTTLDSLADAGYDTSKFNERQRAGAGGSGNLAGVPDLTGLKEGFKARITDGPFKGQEWTLINGTPTRVK